MPIVISTQTVGTTASPGGLDWSKVKELAHKRTDRRGEKTLDLDYELWDVLNDFCSEADWYWRKLTAVITSVANVPIYDLSDAGNANAIGCERIIRVDYAPNENSVAPLDPIVEPDRISSILLNPGTADVPTCYFREPGSESAIRLYRTPNASGMKFLMQFWAVVNQSPDTIPNQIPLVPARHHGILIKGLERNILRYTIGEGSTKFQAVSAEYERMVTKAKRNRYGIVGIHRSFTSDDESIQSS